MPARLDISYTDKENRRWRVIVDRSGTNWIVPPEPAPWFDVQTEDVGEILDLLQRLDEVTKANAREVKNVQQSPAQNS